MSQTSRVHTGGYRLLLNVSTPCTPARIMAGILLFRGVTAQIMPASHPANLELLTVKLGMKKASPLSGTIGGGGGKLAKPPSMCPESETVGSSLLLLARPVAAVAAGVSSACAASH